VGHIALGLLYVITHRMGHRNESIAYDRTKTASIYVWWGICKMVSDIEIITVTSNNRTGDGQYFDRMPDFFLALWFGLVDVMRSDIERQLRSHPRYKIDHL
jgi:hypothetical protein